MVQTWYVRRGDQQRGPYDTEALQRYMLLGRIRVGDELSADGRVWERLHEQHPLYPALLREACTPEGLDRLKAVRRRIDERRPRRRIVAGGMHSSPLPPHGERRRGADPFLEALEQRVRASSAVSGPPRAPAAWLLPAGILLAGILFLALHS